MITSTKSKILHKFILTDIAGLKDVQSFVSKKMVLGIFNSLIHPFFIIVISFWITYQLRKQIDNKIPHWKCYRTEGL